MNPSILGWRVARGGPPPSRAGAILSGASGAAVGAGLVFFFDPQQGARRRAGLSGGAQHLAKRLARGSRTTARDLRYRSRGAARELAGLLRREAVDDAVLAARVRARLGRLTSHPGAIDVRSVDGRVELRGDVLRRELSGLLLGLGRVRGVRSLDNQLQAHETSGHVSSLQGEGTPARARPEFLQIHWSPTARLLAGTLGAGLLGYGAGRRGTAGLASSVVGSALLARGATNLEFKRLLGVGAGPRAIDVQKAIYIERSPEEVFAFFREFENLPQFMSHVKSVEPLGEGRWRWTVAGPAQVPFGWEALVTELVPFQLIAWKSVEGSTVGSVGEVRFDPEGGGTRFSVRMAYNPPAGALGHAVAKLFGADPKKQLDDDLLRLKTLLETGRTRGAGPDERTWTH